MIVVGVESAEERVKLSPDSETMVSPAELVVVKTGAPLDDDGEDDDDDVVPGLKVNTEP